MNKVIDVLGIGNAIVDILCSVDDDELQHKGLIKGSMALIDDETRASLDATVKPICRQSGGSVANSVVHVAELSGRSQYIGKVANDTTGQQFMDDMGRSGVIFNSTVLNSGASTGRCFVFVTPDGQRTMCTYLGACVDLSIDDVDVAAIKRSKTLLIEGYLWSSLSAREMILKSAAIAQESETLVAFSLSDPYLVDGYRLQLQEFVQNYVDLLFGNEREMEELHQTHGLDDTIVALSPLVSHLVITRGEFGSVAVVNDEMFKCSAVPVEEVVDTTGAGDAYAGGYLYGFAREFTVAQCMSIASDVAGRVIGHFGGRNMQNNN